MTDALKPCPFCGSDDVEALDMEGKHYVVCYDCALEGPFHKSRAAVIAAWNTRAALAAPGVPPEWQPIETAPAYPFVKERWYVDGPRYLLSTGSSVFIGQYGYTERGKGRWQDHYGRVCQPTHWMPLPAAPTAQQGASHEQP